MAKPKIDLSSLSPAPGSRRKPKRVGRGPGTGHGKTACRGNKGQLSRSGRKQYVGFEGGQMPLHRRLPKRGFTNIFRKEYTVMNVGDLPSAEGEITPDRLIEAGLIKKSFGDGLKILGGGEISRALVVKAHRFSRSAHDKITKAGGRAEIISRAPAPETTKSE